MSDWTAPAFIDALADTVAARSDLQALTSPTVTVVRFWPAVDDQLGGDVIVVGWSAEDTNEPAALGQGRYAETVTVSCEIHVVRPGGGATVSEAARARAAVLLGMVDNSLRTADGVTSAVPHLKVGDQTTHKRIATRRLDDWPDHDGDGTPIRICAVEFTVEYTARTSVPTG